ncbi:MAG: permease [Thermoleophilia bacterium]|nr:permease [Thermoleophilia bacterium]
MPIDPTGVVLITLVGAGYAATRYRSAAKARQAARIARKSLLGMLPTFAAVFGLVGLFQVFVPASLVERWLGAAAGPSSLLVGAVLGSVAAGPPAAAFPIAGSLLGAGAWMAAVAAFIVSWVLVGVVSLPFEGRVFGWRYALMRNGTCFLFAMVIGLGMGWLL